ncbi:MAG: NUDIX hydrolase, partial [Phycisphaerae bacterium]
MTTPPPIYAAAIIEDPDGRVLIVLPYDETGPDRRWRFPIGRVRDGESPEAAMRRITRSDLGVDVDIDQCWLVRGNRP